MFVSFQMFKSAFQSDKELGQGDMLPTHSSSSICDGAEPYIFTRRCRKYNLFLVRLTV